MKKVHTPENVAHLFANQLQDEARTQTNNFYFWGDRIFSYGSHFVIAKHYNGVLLFTLRSYSNTTAKHINHVANASNHLKRVFCYHPDGTQENNFSAWIYEAEKNIEKLKRANKPVIYLNNLDRIKQQAQIYCDLFKIPINEHLSTILAITDKQEAKEYENKKQAFILAEKQRKEKQLKKEHARALDKWRNFEISSLYQRDGFDYLRFNKEKQRFETSQRIEIPLALGLKIYDKIKNGVQFDKILDYSVTEINKTFIRVGCHKITIKEINTILKTI
jgi:hypothetical protein